MGSHESKTDHDSLIDNGNRSDLKVQNISHCPLVKSGQGEDSVNEKTVILKCKQTKKQSLNEISQNFAKSAELARMTEKDETANESSYFEYEENNDEVEIKRELIETAIKNKESCRRDDGTTKSQLNESVNINGDNEAPRKNHLDFCVNTKNVPQSSDLGLFQDKDPQTSLRAIETQNEIISSNSEPYDSELAEGSGIDALLAHNKESDADDTHSIEMDTQKMLSNGNIFTKKRKRTGKKIVKNPFAFLKEKDIKIEGSAIPPHEKYTNNENQDQILKQTEVIRNEEPLSKEIRIQQDETLTEISAEIVGTEAPMQEKEFLEQMSLNKPESEILIGTKYTATKNIEQTILEPVLDLEQTMVDTELEMQLRDNVVKEEISIMASLYTETESNLNESYDDKTVKCEAIKHKNLCDSMELSQLENVKNLEQTEHEFGEVATTEAAETSKAESSEITIAEYREVLSVSFLENVFGIKEPCTMKATEEITTQSKAMQKDTESSEQNMKKAADNNKLIKAEEDENEIQGITTTSVSEISKNNFAEKSIDNKAEKPLKDEFMKKDLEIKESSTTTSELESPTGIDAEMIITIQSVKSEIDFQTVESSPTEFIIKSEPIADATPQNSQDHVAENAVNSSLSAEENNNNNDDADEFISNVGEQSLNCSLDVNVGEDIPKCEDDNCFIDSKLHLRPLICDDIASSSAHPPPPPPPKESFRLSKTIKLEDVHHEEELLVPRTVQEAKQKSNSLNKKRKQIENESVEKFKRILRSTIQQTKKPRRNVKYSEKDSAYSANVPKNAVFPKVITTRQKESSSSSQILTAKKPKLNKKTKTNESRIEFPKPLNFKVEKTDQPTVAVELPIPMVIKSETDLNSNNHRKQHQPTVLLKRLDLKDMSKLCDINPHNAARQGSSNTNNNFSIRNTFSLNPTLKLHRVNKFIKPNTKHFPDPTKAKNGIISQGCSITEATSNSQLHAPLITSRLNWNQGHSFLTSTPMDQQQIPHNRNATSVTNGNTLLLQIAAERAFINFHLSEFGYSPMQFDLYNSSSDLNVFIKYIFGPDKI